MRHDFFQGVPQMNKISGRGAEILMVLPIPAQQGQADQQPPGGSNEKRQGGSVDGPNTGLFCCKHQSQTCGKRKAGTQIAPGISLRGDYVYPRVFRYIRQHGVIEHQTAGKANFSQQKQGEKCHPAHRQCQQGAADASNQQEASEDGFSFAVPVCGSAQ